MVDSKLGFDLTVNSFQEFAKTLLDKEEFSVYTNLGLQEFAYRMIKQLQDKGMDLDGNTLSEKEIEYSNQILNRIVKNLERIKLEVEETEQD